MKKNMVEPPKILMEIRGELMISPKGGKPISKTSHFIKPMLKITDKTPELPSISLPLRPILPKCSFNGWRKADDEWCLWVDELHSRYKCTWKKAGIYDAILSTRYNVVRNEELVLGLAERWCCDTNTFVFPWGETSITLEDVMVLGGFSVLGNSVMVCVNDKQVDEVEKQLLDVYNSLRRESLTGVDQSVWMKRFMGRKSEIEHAAFLCLWLSRFVFPSYPFDSIVPKYFRVAICLGKGREIAIAPFVLASIYKDLSLLKSAMENVDNVDEFSDLLMITLWAPLQWVQVWAWERFPEFAPKPNDVGFGQPRLARWDNVDKQGIGNVRPMLQSSGDSFVWRPYCVAVGNLPLPGLFREEEQLVFMGENVGKEVKVMAHCLRVTELVGLESIEQYNPHRVAMQFGYDQDLPCVVKRSLINSGMPQKELEQLAWLSYVNPVKNELLYIPSRLYKPQVTVRYLKWLRDGVLTWRAALDGIVTRKRNSVRFRRLQPTRLLFDNDEADSPPRITPRNMTASENDLHRDFEMSGSGNCVDVPPGFPPKFNGSKKSVGHAIDVLNGIAPESICTNLDVPPGFLQNSCFPKVKPDVPHESKLKRNVGRIVDVTPGFVLKSVGIGNNLDVPPGFTPNSTAAKKRKSLSQDFTLETTIGRVVDVSPGFVSKSIRNDLDVPPGFKPQCIAPTKLDASRNHGSVVETIVKGKTEHVESSGQAMCINEARNDAPVVSSSSSDNISRVRQPPGFKPQCIAPMKLDASKDHGSAVESLVKVKMEHVESSGQNEAGNDAPVVSSSSSDVIARLRQLEKMLAAFKEAT